MGRTSIQFLKPASYSLQIEITKGKMNTHLNSYYSRISENLLHPQGGNPQSYQIFKLNQNKDAVFKLY